MGISVAVYNGTTTGGLASRAAKSLEVRGFTVTGTGECTRQDLAATVIEYGPDRKTQAQRVAALFPGAGLRPVTACRHQRGGGPVLRDPAHHDRPGRRPFDGGRQRPLR
ncbi:LytR C-terminal domain-containing protein [Streptomyces sp. L7]